MKLRDKLKKAEILLPVVSNIVLRSDKSDYYIVVTTLDSDTELPESYVRIRNSDHIIVGSSWLSKINSDEFFEVCCNCDIDLESEEWHLTSNTLSLIESRVNRIKVTLKELEANE